MLAGCVWLETALKRALTGEETVEIWGAEPAVRIGRGYQVREVLKMFGLSQ